MKLDKIKFARLIAWLAPQIEYRESFNVWELDNLIDIDVEPVSIPLNLNAVDGLMACMAQGTQKIEAIKYHRSLTGMGLKESKDIVEKYWRANDKGYSRADLTQKLKDARFEDDTEYYAVERFLNSL